MPARNKKNKQSKRKRRNQPVVSRESQQQLAIAPKKPNPIVGLLGLLRSLVALVLRRLGGPFPAFLFPRNFTSIWGYFSEHRWRLVLLLVGGMLSVPLQLVASFLLKEIFDHAVFADGLPLLLEGGLLEAVRSFADYQARIVIISAMIRLRTDIDVRRTYVAEHGLCPANVLEALPTDIEYLQDALTEGTSKIILGGINIACYLLVMLLLIGNAALFAATICLLMGVVIGETYRFLFKAWEAHRDSISIVNRAYKFSCHPREIPDSLVNNRKRADGRMSRFKAVYPWLDRSAAAQRRAAFWDSLAGFVSRWGATAVLVAVFFVAGVLKLSPSSVGRSIVLVALLERYGDALIDLVRGGIALQRGHVGMRNIHYLLVLPQAPALPETDLPAGDCLIVKKLALIREGTVVFRNVWFTARIGEITIIIGSRGKGKTPLLFTLAGWFQPSSGQILLVDSKQKRRKKVTENQAVRRELLHLVLDRTSVNWQVDTLFDLFQAVRPDEEAEEEDTMWQVLERVGIQEEVSRLPEGLRNLLVDSLTGRRFLSEDVLLLASIARALLTNSLGILLDEPLRRSGRQDVWEVIKMMAREKIIIVSVDSEEDLKGLDMSGVRINKVRLNAEIKREGGGAGARTAETFLN